MVEDGLTVGDVLRVGMHRTGAVRNRHWQAGGARNPLLELRGLPFAGPGRRGNHQENASDGRV